MRLPLRAWKNTLTSLGLKTKPCKPTRFVGYKASLEQLECRKMRTINTAFDVGTGVLTITGDGANDSITVAASGGGVTVNSNPVNGGTAASDVTAIVIDAGAGDDYVSLTGVTKTDFTHAGLEITVYGGPWLRRNSRQQAG